MPESFFSSLLHSLDKSNISQIASSLGESERGVFRGVESSIASVLGAMAGKAEDPNALRGMLDLVPESAGEISWSKLVGGLSTPGFPWIAKGKQMLSGVFGNNHAAVTNAVSKECGIGEGTATTLLAMAVPIVMRFINRRVLDQGLSMKSLGAILERESATIRGALPAGLSAYFWPHETMTTASPVIAQSVQREKSSGGWLAALCLGALALGGIWLWSHSRRPAMDMGGEASRAATEPSTSGDYVRRRLPTSVDLRVPANGVESQLLGIIVGSSTADRKAWLDFDRLLFDSGSATLRPGSGEQLDNVAAILKAYPNVKIAIAGFTDNVGNDEQNLQLSRARAQNVKVALVSRGITMDRLMAEGFGERSSMADNSSAVGRAQNRRVSLQVTQR